MDGGSWRWFYDGLLVPCSSSSADTPARLRKARSFIDRHFDQPLDLDLIARQAHFSQYHFLRLFRRAYGETPHRYLQRQRISTARRLLESTELSVTQVCLAVGFSSLGSFSGLFSSVVGHAPSRYRARVFSVPELPDPKAIPHCFLNAFGVSAA